LLDGCYHGTVKVGVQEHAEEAKQSKNIYFFKKSLVSPPTLHSYVIWYPWQFSVSYTNCIPVRANTIFFCTK